MYWVLVLDVVYDDPYGDVIISAFGYYRSSMQGRAYLFYGSTKTSMDVVCDRTFDEDVPPVSNYGKEAKLCDLNNDGWIDIITGDIGDEVYVWENDGTPWQPWTGTNEGSL